MARLLFLEFNEVSFESLSYYCSKGLLPAFAEIIERSGWSTTSSEQTYEHLEPWIQWVTAHTGLSFAQHGVFRLGDIVSRDLPQIWEQLEEQGLKVGAICPMNAKHRLRNPAFFVPDPWTPTDITAPPLLERLAAAISQAVNDNATSRLTPRSAASLLAGILAYAHPTNYPCYLALGVGALRQSWKRALFLDLLLADVFVREVRRTRPDFATVFLNAAAHIQHHYMFSSASYQGTLRNPSWYLPDGQDPVLEVYRLYDRILRMVREAFPDTRIMIATGLHQVPYREVTYYWRLKDHESFLRRIGVPFERVEPRMSRDFLLVCANEVQARTAAERLQQAVAHDGLPLFEIDNRGSDIFAMLTYPKEITAETRFRVGETQYSHLHSHVAFVALKNGEHDGTGYFLDSGVVKGVLPEQMRLAEIPQRIAQALNVALRLPA